jgi:hypothetical protein
MYGTGRRIILYATTPRPTPRIAYTLNFKNKTAKAKADHVISTAKAKKEQVELYFYFPYTLS